MWKPDKWQYFHPNFNSWYNSNRCECLTMHLVHRWPIKNDGNLVIYTDEQRNTLIQLMQLGVKDGAKLLLEGEEHICLGNPFFDGEYKIKMIQHPDDPMSAFDANIKDLVDPTRWPKELL